VSRIFTDTSGWASFFIRTEPFHHRSVELLDELRKDRRIAVTTKYVIAELIALLTSPLRIPRPEQIGILDAISGATWVDVIHIDRERDRDGLHLFKAYPDKTWSLVDCCSFAVMRAHGMTDALTNDRHFEQAGLICLLKSH
jgi:predicted nucleic acid-binding protein